MSEAVGLINYDDDNNEVFIGRDLAHTARGYGEGVATVIDQEVKRIIDECYDRARHIIRKYDDVLHTCADLLAGKRKDFPGRIWSAVSGRCIGGLGGRAFLSGNKK